jgi:hypothetical protein
MSTACAVKESEVAEEDLEETEGERCRAGGGGATLDGTPQFGWSVTCRMLP